MISLTISGCNISKKKSKLGLRRSEKTQKQYTKTISSLFRGGGKLLECP
jgi:hypothetical protein